MGTWEISIKGNDTFQDIYCSFYDHYNNGEDPKEISKSILANHKEAFEDKDDRNNAYFGLALAQWETKSLDPEIYKIVKVIIQTNEDIKTWESLGADKPTLKKREKELYKLLAKLSKRKDKPKRRVKSKLDFQSIKLIELTSPDGRKKFSLAESLTNGEYKCTYGMISWQNGGGGIIHYDKSNRDISAKWLDANTLEIIHNKEIVFTQKNVTCFYGEMIIPPTGGKPVYRPNEVKIIYKNV